MIFLHFCTRMKRYKWILFSANKHVLIILCRFICMFMNEPKNNIKYACVYVCMYIYCKYWKYIQHIFIAFMNVNSRKEIVILWRYYQDSVPTEMRKQLFKAFLCHKITDFISTKFVHFYSFFFMSAVYKYCGWYLWSWVIWTVQYTDKLLIWLFYYYYDIYVITIINIDL